MRSFKVVRELKPLYQGGHLSIIHSSPPPSNKNQNPSASTYLLASSYTEINLLDIDTSTIISSYSSPTGLEITAIGSLPSASHVFIALSNSTCILSSNPFTWQQDWKWREDYAITAVAFSQHKDDDILLIASAKGKLKGYNWREKFATHDIETAIPAINLLLLHPTPEKWDLFVCGLRGAFKVINLKNPEMQVEMKGHTDTITAIEFIPEKKIMISASRDGTLCFWDMDSYYRIAIVVTDESNEILFRAPDNMRFPRQKGEQFIVTGGSEGVLKVREVEKRKVVAKFKIDSEHEIARLAVDKKRKRWIFATDERLLLFYDMEKVERKKILFGENLDVSHICNMKEQLAFISQGTKIRLMHSKLVSYEGRIMSGHTKKILAIAVRKGFLISGGRDETVRLWDMEKGKCVGVGEGHFGVVSDVAFFNKSDHAVSLSSNGVLKMWDLKNAIEGEGKKLVEISSTNPGERHAKCIAVSRRDQFIATAGKDKKVRVWSVKSSAIITMAKELVGHRGSIHRLEFAKNTGHFLISASSDRTIRLWDIQAGECIQVREDMLFFFFNSFLRLLMVTQEWFSMLNSTLKMRER